MGKTRTKVIDATQEVTKEPQEKKALPEEQVSEKVVETKKETKKPQKPGKAKPRSKKYQAAIKDLDRTKTYPIPEAVDMVKKLNYAKFNATLNISINTAQTGIRGLISLPYAGKTEYKTEPKAAVIHLGLGQLNQPTEELSANIKTLLQTLGKSKVKKVSLSPTMGPSVRVDLTSV